MKKPDKNHITDSRKMVLDPETAKRFKKFEIDLQQYAIQDEFGYYDFSELPESVKKFYDNIKKDKRVVVPKTRMIGKNWFYKQYMKMKRETHE